MSIDSNAPRVIKAGLGVESTGMICGMIEAGDRPDAILFADTGGEREYTYQLRDDLNRLLDAHGFPEITVVHATLAGAPITLEEHSLRLRRMPSVSYGRKSCSVRFKVEPSDKWIAAWEPAQAAWAAGGKVTLLIGYNVDEVARYTKVGRDPDRFAYEYWLVNRRWTREDCRTAAARFGLYPEKSSCFFCGSARPSEVRRLRRDAPGLFARGLAMESNAKPFLGSIRGLGKNFAWSDVEDEANRQGRLFATVLGEASEDDSPMDCECHEGGAGDD